MVLIFAFTLKTFGISFICWIDNKKVTFKTCHVREKCKFIILKFSKVMQQHTYGVVGNLISVLLEI